MFDLLRYAQRRLACAGVENPDGDALHIVKASMQLVDSRSEQVVVPDKAVGLDKIVGLEQVVGSQEATLFTSALDIAEPMLKRCCEGEPLQYVLGSWGFRWLELQLDTRVLIPRPETEIVAESAIIEVQKRDNPVIADLGTGSGAIALSVAVECPGVRVLATDISQDALAVARSNLAYVFDKLSASNTETTHTARPVHTAQHIAIAQPAHPVQPDHRLQSEVEFYAGDWFNALPSEFLQAIDVIVANPPYIGTNEVLPDVVADWEPSVALRAGVRGDEQIIKIIQNAQQWMRRNGVLIIEIAPHQSYHVREVAEQVGFKTQVKQDLSHRDRTLICTLR